MGGDLSTSKSQYSSGIEVKDNRISVLPGRKQQLMIVKPVLVSAFYLSLALQVCFKLPESTPIVGLSRCGTINDVIKEPSLKDCPHLIFWSVSEGIIFFKGREHCKTRIRCTDRCLVELTLKEQRIVIINITSTSGDCQREEISVPLTDGDYWLVLGAINSGASPIVFEVPPQIHDVTLSTRFAVIDGEMNVSSNGHTILRTSTMRGNSVGFLNHVISDGIHHWKLEVICDFGASICIGLATHDFQMTDKYRDPRRHIYHHKKLIVWRSYRGFLYQYGRQLQRSIEPLGWQSNVPVIVELHLDMYRGTLEILKNGRSLGVAFTDIQGRFQPVVAFYASYEKEVRLREYHSSTTSAEIVEVDRSHFVRSDKTNFDPQTVTGLARITDDGMTLYRPGEHTGNAYCLLNQTLLNGHYRWSFVIQSDQGASTCVGVAREPIILNEGNVYLSSSVYVLRSFRGMLYFEGKEIPKRFSEFWLSGSLVEMIFEVDSKGGVLKYSINGEYQGIAFTDIKPPVKPIVGFYAGMEKKVTLIHYEHRTNDTHAEAPVLEKVKLNNLNAEMESPCQHPLPVCTRQSDASIYYNTCMNCGEQANVIALPCKHSASCAKHLISDGTQTCLICEAVITGVWNILIITP